MRTLALSIGNTSLRGGWFEGRRLVKAFQAPVGAAARRAALRRLLKPTRGTRIDAAVLCSVVPGLTRSVMAEIRRATGIAPYILTAESSHGLRIRYRRPGELGADRVAAALGAQARFPRRDVIIVDCGTATTVTAVGREGAVLGGAILPGFGLWAELLARGTAQLPKIGPRRPRRAVGRSPDEAIGSGLFFGHFGAIRELVSRIRTEAFAHRRPLIVGTGGNAAFFANERLFDKLEPALVLHGLRAMAK